MIFFTTFPVVGTSAGVRGYLAGNMKQHLLGVVGGILWGTGMLSTLLIIAAPQNAQPGALYQYPLNHLLNGGYPGVRYFLGNLGDHIADRAAGTERRSCSRARRI